MAHMLVQIRDAINADLSTLASASVFVDRVYPIEKQELPCVILAVGNETSSVATFGGSGYGMDRIAAVDLTICVSATTGYDSTAAQIQLDVEKLLAADFSLGGLVSSLTYMGRQKSISGDGDKPFVAFTLTYDAMYRVQSTSPDVAG